MDAREILRRIDQGAEHFLRTLADAPHMTYTAADGYTVIRPRDGEEGVSFVCGLLLEGLSPAQSAALIARVRAEGLPVWFPLLATDEQIRQFFGRARIHGAPLGPEDEVYMALLPDGLTAAPLTLPVQRVTDAAAFADCARVINAVLSGGRPDLHPVHHLLLVETGRIRAHVAYHGGQPVSAAVTMGKDGAASLEFVATLPAFRRMGYAGAVCRQAVQDALACGVDLVTVRAVNPAVARLYERLGFRAYNHAL